MKVVGAITPARTALEAAERESQLVEQCRFTVYAACPRMALETSVFCDTLPDF